MTVPALLLIVGLVASSLYWFYSILRMDSGRGRYCIFPVCLLNWKVDIWVVTNYRVIDETGLINHYAKESPLEKINNVSYDQNIWGRIFNYGHVEIQTAAEIGATDYFNVHHPKRLKDTITLAQSEYKNLQLSSQAKQMAAAMGWQSNATATAGAGSTGRGYGQNIASELKSCSSSSSKAYYRKMSTTRPRASCWGRDTRE